MRALRAPFALLGSALRLGALAAIGSTAGVWIFFPDIASRLVANMPAFERVAPFAWRPSIKLGTVHVAGRKHTEMADVLEALGRRPGEDIFGFDYEAARLRLESIGWVERASVALVPPGDIRVELVERTPALLWQRNGAFHLLDADGVPIVEAPPDAPFPAIVGEGAERAAPEALQILRTNPWLARRLLALVRVEGRRWNVELDGGLGILAPEEGAAKALARLPSLAFFAALDSAGAADGRTGRVIIDLRVSGRIGLRHASGPTL